MGVSVAFMVANNLGVCACVLVYLLVKQLWNHVMDFLNFFDVAFFYSWLTTEVNPL